MAALQQAAVEGVLPPKPNGEDQKRQSAMSASGEPEGIGGWMLLPLLGLVLGPVLVVANLYAARGIFDAEVFQRLATSQPALFSFALGSFAFAIVVLCYMVFCLVKMLTKHHRTPYYMQVLYVGIFGLAIFETAGALYYSAIYGEAEVADSIKSLVQSVISLAIWIPYFRVSKRVKNTFRSPEQARNEMTEVFS